MSTEDVPGANAANNDHLQMGCWAEADQGKYHYVYGPYAEPILRVDPGAVISAETHDAFEGAIRNETDSPSARIAFTRA